MILDSRPSGSPLTQWETDGEGNNNVTMQPVGAFLKSHLISKTPPALRATSSINRGGAGDSSRRQGYFNSPTVYRGSTPKGRELKNDF